MATVTHSHFGHTGPSPRTSQSDWVWVLGRLAAGIIGAVTVWVQVKYTWATLPQDDMAMRAAPVLFAVGLAGSLVYVETHWRRSQYWKVVGWLIAFAVLLVGNLVTTVTRVSEVHAQKASAGEHAGDIQQKARDAWSAATRDEADTREKMQRFCEMVKVATTTETNTRGKKKVSVTSKSDASIDPRCASWSKLVDLAAKRTEAARVALSTVTIASSVDGVSPAAKSISTVTKWNPVTVDHSLDFVQPIGLDVLALIAFLTAFSSKERPREAKQRKAQPPLVKSLPQADINARVEQWLNEEGLPVGAGVGACLKHFRTWAGLPDAAVTFVTFGRALDALNIERRSLNGRRVVAGRR